MAEVKIRESNFSDKIPRFRDDELKKQKVVGQGGFGEVVLYQWVDKQSSSSTPIQNVVMKRLLAGSISQKDVKRLEKEAHLLWNISSPFIISLKGLYFGENENEFCIVMEYAPNGSCLDFFRLLGERNRGPHEKIWSLKCRIAYQVIQGMECLHNQKPSKILHLDLKAANVLLDSQLNAKICDFGLSQLHTCTALSRSRARYQKSFGCSGTKKIGGDGTITHIAPEHLQDLNLKSTVKSDVYSFGIFIWELLTCKRPYANAKKGVVMAAVGERQERPNVDDIPPTAPAVLLKMMRNSYKQDPKDRPTFTEQRLDHGLELESHEAMAKKAVDFILQNSCSDVHSSLELEISSSLPDPLAINRDKTLKNTEDHSHEISTAESAHQSAVKSQNVVDQKKSSKSSASENTKSHSRTSSTENGHSSTVERQNVVDQKKSCEKPTSDRTKSHSHTSTTENEHPSVAGSLQVAHQTNSCKSSQLNSVLLSNLHGTCEIAVDGNDTSTSKSFCKAFLETSIRPSEETAPKRPFQPDSITKDASETLVYNPTLLQQILHNSCWKQKLNTSKSTSAYSSRTNYIYKSCSKNDSGEKQRELKSSGLPQTETDEAALHGKGRMKLVFAIATVLPLVTVLTVLIILFAVNGSSFCFLSGSCDVVADADIDRSLAFSSNSTNENNCKPPSPVTNGELKCTDTTYSTNTLCFVTCQSGYRLSGSNTLLCLKNGSWLQTESQCRNSNINDYKRECPAEDMPLDVIEQHCTDGYYEGSVCRYGCLHNKGIQTRNSRTCSKFGRWSHPIPTCACSGCFGGSGCSERLTWEKLRLQTKQLKKDGVPISITYGDRLITCESDVDIWFFNYDCSCRDSKELRGFICNNFVNRFYACRHALAMLVRNYVASGLYTAPCDIGSVPANCNS